MEQPMEMRRAGLLAPVFAMRHRDDFGIGDTRAVREAIAFCAMNGFKVLQVLPIQETFNDHSPYNPISSRALSPAYVYLEPEEVPGLSGDDLVVAAPPTWLARLRDGMVRHGSVHPLKRQILHLAWLRFRADGAGELRREFEDFVADEAEWLTKYTMFRLLVREYEGDTEWPDWRPEHQTWEGANEWLLRHPEHEDLEDLRRSYAYAQWVAHRQWQRVKDEAERHEIMLMGEISFGVGRGSADVWANPELFDLDWNLGTRPLAHFDTSKDAERWGQNWGLPSYRWENHRSSGFNWWRGRVRGVRRYFHVCRLDHLRGYFRAYMFPWAGGPRHSEFANLNPDEAMVRTGGKLPRFVPGPDDDPIAAGLNELQGREILGILRQEAGPMELVGELMGAMPDYMQRTLNELPLANMVFPQLERGQPVSSLREYGLITYANHDNAPLVASYRHLQLTARDQPHSTAAGELAWLLEFAGWHESPPPELDDRLLAALHHALLATPCKLAVLMCSDALGLDLRFNLPGSYGKETWCNRLNLPFDEYHQHPTFGPRLECLRRLLRQSGRW